MNIFRGSLAAVTTLVAVACVTINVYFPAAVADRVADQFVQDVYGEEPSASPGPTTEPQPRSSWDGAGRAIAHVLDFLVTPAYAQADLDVDTPAILGIKASLQKRHKELEPFYTSGAIGMTNNGEIAVQDLAAVPLPQRNALRKLVADENAQRATLYREIATANEHPEWEAEIRNVFAQRWISNARAGWSYQAADGSWKTK